MSPLPIYGKKPVVLLTVSSRARWRVSPVEAGQARLTEVSPDPPQNDDGPPSSHSPNIYSFAKLLIEKLGWDVRVVVPATQNSW